MVGPSVVPNTSRVSRPTLASEVRMTARSLMEPLERADHARCWFGVLLGPPGAVPQPWRLPQASRRVLCLHALAEWRPVVRGAPACL